MAPRWLSLSVGLAIAATACECGDPMPPDDTFDGNVIVGDGSSLPDAEADSGFDGGEPEAGQDAGEHDTGEPDATPDAGDRCVEPAVTVLTSSSAVAEVGMWAGMIVEITGTATQTGLSCTDRACPPDEPCCNTCTASVTIDGRVLLTGGECFTPPPGCSGNECAQTCRPLLLELPQTFRGELIDRGEGVALELFSVD
jgi:hypothetical protein